MSGLTDETGTLKAKFNPYLKEIKRLGYQCKLDEGLIFVDAKQTVTFWLNENGECNWSSAIVITSETEIEKYLTN